jgi:hypothetical protein
MLFVAISMIFFLTMFIALVFVVNASINGKGKWGLNLRSTDCPRCSAKVPRIREPKSIHQALWGGATCSVCGCEMDKWGKELNAINPKDTHKQIEEARTNFVTPFDEEGKTPVEKVFEENSK